MSVEAEFPSLKYVDTKIGLKYLNGNKELYFKVLNNFLNRYENLNVELLNDKQLKETMHTLKGLTSTLGMISLSKLTKAIHETLDRKKLVEFSETLLLVIEELRIELYEDKIESILIVDDISNDIDTLIDILGDECDIVVALDKEEAFEVIKTDDISLVIFYNKIEMDEEFLEILRTKNIPIIFTITGLNSDSLKYKCYIKKPFNKEELKKCIKTYCKFGKKRYPF